MVFMSAGVTVYRHFKAVIPYSRQRFVHCFLRNVKVHGHDSLRRLQSDCYRFDTLDIFECFFNLLDAVVAGHAGDLIGMCHLDFDFSVLKHFDAAGGEKPFRLMFVLVTVFVHFQMIPM